MFLIFLPDNSDIQIWQVHAGAIELLFGINPFQNVK